MFSFARQGEHRELIELAPLCVTYFIVFLYLAFSVGKLKISHHLVGVFDVILIQVFCSCHQNMALHVQGIFLLMTALSKRNVCCCR